MLFLSCVWWSFATEPLFRSTSPLFRSKATSPEQQNSWIFSANFRLSTDFRPCHFGPSRSRRIFFAPATLDHLVSRPIFAPATLDHLVLDGYSSRREDIRPEEQKGTCTESINTRNVNGPLLGPDTNERNKRVIARPTLRTTRSLQFTLRAPSHAHPDLHMLPPPDLPHSIELRSTRTV